MEKENLIQLLQEISDYIYANPPTNGYGLLDKKADAECSALQKRISEAIEMLTIPAVLM